MTVGGDGSGGWMDGWMDDDGCASYAGSWRPISLVTGSG